MQTAPHHAPKTVAERFDRAIDYDRHAHVQNAVAEALATRIAGLPLPARARVLEIGCGTGALTERGLAAVPDADWTATDIAPAMLARASSRLAGRPGVSLAVMDGEHPDLRGPFDLICSSLAMQWFADLGTAVERLGGLLAPGGILAFTTLARGSFAEWRAAHDEAEAGVHDYPDTAALAAMGLDVTIREHQLTHANAREFLRSLKGIGAGTPRAGHRPLSPAALRRVMARFEANGAVARYVVASCVLRR